MDIGKAKLQVDTTYAGDPDAALSDLYSTFVTLSQELAVTPGFAAIKTSVAIARGQAVNINNSLLQLADRAGSLPAQGICVKAAGAGQFATIILGMGYARGLSGLTANSSVYLGNAGALLFAKPGAGFIQCLGYALSTTEIWVAIGGP